MKNKKILLGLALMTSFTLMSCNVNNIVTTTSQDTPTPTSVQSTPTTPSETTTAPTSEPTVVPSTTVDTPTTTSEPTTVPSTTPTQTTKPKKDRGTVETNIDEHIPDVFNNIRNESSYVVRHLVEDNTGEYVLIASELLTGTIDELTEAEAKDIEGYTPQDIEQKTISSKGDTIVDVKYKLKVYTITVTGSDSKGSVAGDGEFNVVNNTTKLTAKAFIGYEFTGWYDGETLISTSPSIELSVSDSMDITGKFEVKDEFKDLEFTSDRTTCSITGLLDDTVVDVVIPEGVTEIVENAFKDSDIVSIELPASLQTIGESAFEGSENLACVTIKSIIDIEDQAFSGCTNLTVVNNQSDMYIYSGDNDNGGIGKYANVIIDEDSDIDLVAIVDNCLFTLVEDKLYLTSYLGNDKEYTLPSSVTLNGKEYTKYTMAKRAFKDKTCLEVLIVPKALEEIEDITYDSDAAFKNCENLKLVYNYSSVDLSYPNSQITNYADAVYDLNANSWVESNDLYEYVLTNVNDVIHAEITRYKGNEKDLVIDKIGEYETSIAGGLFKNNSNIETLTLNEGVTNISDNAFYNCENLKTVTANYVKNLGYAVFMDCPKLKIVSISDCEIIGDSAFRNDVSLIDIDFSSLKGIKANAFTDCSNLYKLILPESLSYIEEGYESYDWYYTFEGCYKLKEIVNKSSLSIDAGESYYGYIGYYAISVVDSEADSHITNQNGFIIFNDPSCTQYYNNYSYQYNLATLINYIGTEEDITVPDNVEIIDKNTFRNTNVKKLVIPSTVTHYVDGMLSDAPIETLELASFLDTPLYIMYGGESYDSEGSISSNLKTVILSEGITTIKEEAFKDASKLRNIVIPKTVTSIEEDVFLNCDLNAVYYNGSLIDWIDDTNTILDNPFDYSIFSYTGDENGDIDFFGKKYIAATTLSVPNTMTTIPAGRFSGFDFEKVIIPDSVTEIGKNAFAGCKKLKEVNFPSSLTTIGENAFRDTKLTKVIIPSTVTQVGEGAFANCISLVVVSIPASIGEISNNMFNSCVNLQKVEIGNVTSIGNYAFAGCKLLSTITIPSTVTGIGAYAFTGCAKLETVNIPSDTALATLGSFAFASDISLKTISLKNTQLTSINEATFAGCTSLETLELANSITYIEADALEDCDNLALNEVNGAFYLGTEAKPYNWLIKIDSKFKEITVHEECKVISNNAFKNSKKLEKLVIPNTVDVDNTDFEGILSGCDNLQHLEIPVCYGRSSNKWFSTLFFYYYSGTSTSTNRNYVPKSLKEVVINGNIEIPDSAFDSCYYIESITLGSGVTSVGSGAFMECGNLKNIDFGGTTSIAGNVIQNTAITDLTLSSKVTSLSNYAFAYAYYLESVDMSALTIESFGTDLFCDCDELETVALPATITSIPEGTFYGCDSLGTVSIPSGVTSIGDKAFQATSISTLDLSAYSITSIGSNVFYNCYSLEEIILPTSITRISSGMFNNCKKLESLTIPSNITQIDSYAFSGAGIKTLTIPSTVTAIKAFAFNNSSLESVTLQGAISYSSTASDRESIFYGCKNLTSVTLSSSQQYIYNSMFESCTSLKQITLPSGCFSIGTKAFKNSGLESVNLSNVTLLGNNAFEGTSSLASVTFNTGPGFVKISSECFMNSGLKEVVIPDYVTTISSSAFYNCVYLNKVTLGSGVKTIPASCFASTALTSFVVPSTVTSISSGAFSDCYKLKEIYNLSALNIVVGNTTYGEIAKYALVVHNSLSDPSCIAQVDDYVFMLDNGNASLVSYIGSSEDITLPASFEHESVTYNTYEIGERAFNNSKTLKSIVIPDSVTKIGNYAFYNCSVLESVTIGNGVSVIGEQAFRSDALITSLSLGTSITTISERAFQSCSGLTNVVLPDSVETIGTYAFCSCKGLTNITFGTNLTSIGECAFYECDVLDNLVFNDALTTIGTKAFYQCKGITTIDFNKVETIENYAFYECKALESLVLGNNVETIGNYAFKGCNKLVSITFDDALTTIGTYAFSGCSKLASVTFNDNLETIGTRAFEYTYGLTEVTFNSKQTIGDSAFVQAGIKELVIPNVTIEKDAFFGADFTKVTFEEGITTLPEGIFNCCDQLKDIVLPSTLTIIPKNAFYQCYALETITIPDSVETIGYYAFYNCTKLAEIIISDNSKLETLVERAFMYTKITTINLPKTLTEIGSEAFRATSLQSITIPENVATYGTYIFSGCTSLETVTINAKSTSGSYMFYNCSAIKTVVFGNTNETISSDIFKGCSKLTSVTFSNKLTTIGNNAFYECKLLESFELPSTLTTIGSCAFYTCEKITEVTIPASVTSIGSSAFAYCSKLESFTFEDGIDISTIPSFMLDGCPKLLSIKIPSTVTTIERDAFGYCDSLTTITIPASVTSIGSSLVSNCTNLREIIFEEGCSITSIPAYAFKYCLKLTTISMPSTVISIDNYAFKECKALSSIELSPNVTTIGQYAFSESAIESITIKSKVTSIDVYAFYKCNLLKTVVFENGTDDMTIGAYAFSECSGIASITLPNTLVEVGRYAFYKSGIKSITFPGSVTSVEEYAFSECPGLETVVFENGTENKQIEQYAFYKSSKIKTVTLPNTLTDIGTNAFKQCSSLKEILLPSSINAIGNYAFEECGIEILIIKCKVNASCEGCFKNCTSLKVVYVDGMWVPDKPSQYTSLSIIGQYWFDGCTSLEYIVLSNVTTDTSIGSGAFNGCTSFDKVFFTSNAVVDIHLNMSDTTQQYVNATKYVYSETEPTDTDNNYWHYVEGEPTIWETA